MIGIFYSNTIFNDIANAIKICIQLIAVCDLGRVITGITYAIIIRIGLRHVRNQATVIRCVANAIGIRVQLDTGRNNVFVVGVAISPAFDIFPVDCTAMRRTGADHEWVNKVCRHHRPATTGIPPAVHTVFINRTAVDRSRADFERP